MPPGNGAAVPLRADVTHMMTRSMTRFVMPANGGRPQDGPGPAIGTWGMQWHRWAGARGVLGLCGHLRWDAGVGAHRAHVLDGRGGQVALAAEFGIFLPHCVTHLGERGTGLVERAVGGHRRAAIVLEHSSQFAVEEKSGLGFCHLALALGSGW